MADTIIRATPRSVMLGTQDSSTVQQPAVQEARPQHCPFFFLFAEKGPLEPTFVTAEQAKAIFGNNSFDLRKEYATHGTVFANRAIAQGNACFIQRLKPEDAAPPASVRLWADVLETTVQDYERNADGSIKVTNGVPVAAGAPIPGFKVKFVLTQVEPDADDGSDTFGLATQEAGDQTDADTQQQSVRYPLLDTRVPHFGKAGNLNGLRLWAPTTGGRNPIDQTVVRNETFYPFRLALVQRPDELSSPKISTTLAGAQFIDFSLKPGAFDRANEREMYLGDIFLENYQNVDSASGTVKYGPFGDLYVYDSQVATLLTQLYNAEKTHLDAFSDFTGEAGEEYRFNLFGGTSSSGSPYHSYQLVTGTGGAVRLAENSNLMAAGGSDGVMNNTVYAELVEAACAQFEDTTSPLRNLAKYPYSDLYDSGFPLSTKKALCKFLSGRKNTAVSLATHVVGGKPLTAAEETAMATTLLAHIQTYPESEFYGTSTMRGMLLGGSGTYKASGYRQELPMTIELLDKAASYMGASDGNWKSAERFDVDSGRDVKLLSNLNVNARSDDTRDANWVIGLVTPESYDRTLYYFDAFQTVYDRDDSVLNSYMTMKAICDLQVLGDEARRKFSGRSDLTNLEFVTELNKYMEARIVGRYDNRFIIKPQAFITAFDEARGYSWTMQIEIGAPGMKTVQTLSVIGRRIEDMMSSS